MFLFLHICMFLWNNQEIRVGNSNWGVRKKDRVSGNDKSIGHRRIVMLNDRR